MQLPNDFYFPVEQGAHPLFAAVARRQPRDLVFVLVRHQLVQASHYGPRELQAVRQPPIDLPHLAHKPQVAPGIGDVLIGAQLDQPHSQLLLPLCIQTRQRSQTLVEQRPSSRVVRQPFLHLGQFLVRGYLLSPQRPLHPRRIGHGQASPAKSLHIVFYSLRV